MPRVEDDSREFYLKILDDFPALIWRSGLDMKCDYFNNTWLAFTGRTLEQEFGDGWVEGVHPDDIEKCVSTYGNSFRSRESFAMFYRLKNRFGEYRWIKDIGRPFFNLNDDFMGYIGSCYDVTEERENASKLEELNRLKDKFFSIIAHDLTGPVTAIEAVTELLAKDYTVFSDTERDSLIRELYKTASEVCRFLRDILAWSHSQIQGQTCIPEESQVHPLIDEAVDPLHGSMRAKKIIFQNSVDAGLIFYADPNMVKLIIRNLVSNAIKFCRVKGVINITGEAKDGFTLIRVIDDGIGISPVLIETLFDPGNKKKRSGTSGEKGSGLGLMLCREFAEKNRGKIWVESRVNEGSTFTLMLPEKQQK